MLTRTLQILKGSVPDEESEDRESEDEDGYDDCLTEEEWQNLFGTSDDEENFDGFQRAGTVLADKTAPFGATK